MVCSLISLSPRLLSEWTKKLPVLFFPPSPCGLHSWPSFPSHYCSCTQHIVISHCRHQSPLNQLDYLLYRRRHHLRRNASVWTDCVSCWITLMEKWFSYGFTVPVHVFIAQKWTRKKKNLHLCNIYDSRYISVLFETPRIIVCAVYIADTLHIGHWTSLWIGTPALSKKQKKLKYMLI